VAKGADIGAVLGAGENGSAAYDGLLADMPWLSPQDTDRCTTPIQPTDASDVPAVLQFTSGSTSVPKGVRLSHGNIIANLDMIRTAVEIDRNSVLLTWLPLFHDMGFVNVLMTLYAGVTSVLMPPLQFVQSPARWLRAIERYRATVSGGPNFAFDRCADLLERRDVDRHDLSSWRVAMCGSEPVRAATMKRFAAAAAPHGFQSDALFPCYGLAEATVFVSGGPRQRGVGTFPPTQVGAAMHPVVSCGQPAHLSTILIVDPDTLAPLQEPEIGEIWIHGKHVAAGYWNNSTATAAIFEARLSTDSSAGPFLRSGDLGFLRDGELYVSGRRKALLVHRGSKLHPEDIEASIASSHRSFGNVGAVFAFDADGSEEVIAVHEIVGREFDKHYAVEMIDRALDAVAEQHGVRLYDLALVRTGTIPRTSSGKVQRERCQELYRSESLAFASDLRHPLLRRYSAARRRGGADDASGATSK
jgi:acyl-CoA synthetase (AMP-forming)/AMP-acid ligase II